MKTALLLLTALVLSGCSYTLPAVSGDSITYVRRDPLGGTDIKATGVKVTDTHITAQSATWTTTYPQFSISLTVENYRQKRKPTAE